MKTLTTILIAGLTTVSFTACGGSDGGSDAPVNNTEYDLREAMVAPYAGLLDLSFSTGDTGSVYVSKVVSGTTIINGLPATVLDEELNMSVNGINVNADATAIVDTYGNTVETETTIDGTTVTCDLSSGPEPMPTNAKVGAKSDITRTYNCDDGTLRAYTWELKDAGNGNAKLVYTTIISGAAQSESISEFTFTGDISPVFMKIDVDYKNGNTMTANGSII